MTGLFYGRQTKPTEKAAAEDDLKPSQHAVENIQKQLTRSTHEFSTHCEDVKKEQHSPSCEKFSSAMADAKFK